MDLDEVVLGAVGGPAVGPVVLPASPLDIAQFIALHAAACVGADYSNVALLNATGESLRIFHGSPLDQEIADRYTEVAVDAPYPITAAARLGSSVVLPDLEAYQEHFPDIIGDTIAAGIGATASLPLQRIDGTPLGAIGFGWAHPPTFDPKLRSALEAAALLCSQTLERAERYDDEHQIIVELQRRILDDLPQCDGFDIAARYLPAGGSTPVGGDWYESLRLDEDRVAFVVGDVAGHGVTAAADMALARGMITALLHSGVAVADVFSEVTAVLSQSRALVLASAALVVVDEASETMTFATAGHPPPLILDRGGHVRALNTANSPLIGLNETLFAGTYRLADTAPFPCGSQLVLYTDGLVERRDRSFATGVEQMATGLSDIPTHLRPVELIDALLAALIGTRTPTDDIAILVVEQLSRST